MVKARPSKPPSLISMPRHEPGWSSPYGLGVYVAFVSPNVSIPDVATGVTRLRLTATDGNGRVVGEEVTP